MLSLAFVTVHFEQISQLLRVILFLVFVCCFFFSIVRLHVYFPFSPWFVSHLMWNLMNVNNVCHRFDPSILTNSVSYCAHNIDRFVSFVSLGIFLTRIVYDTLHYTHSNWLWCGSTFLSRVICGIGAFVLLELAKLIAPCWRIRIEFLCNDNIKCN